MKEYDYQISLESEDGGEISRHGHFNLLRLKVAAGIAFLHESPVIEDLHVEIANVILAASKRTQAKCERTVAEAEFNRKKAARRSDARINEEVGDERLAELVKNARAALVRAEGEWVVWHNLRPRSSARDEYGEPVWDTLCEMEDVECEETPQGQGVRRKARFTGDTA